MLVSPSLPSNLREQTSRDFLVLAALCNPAYEREAVEPFGSKRQSAYISVLISLLEGYFAHLCFPLPALALHHPPTSTSPRSLVARHRVCYTPYLLRRQAYPSATTSTSAHPASAQIAKDSTTSDKPARSPKQPRSQPVGATAFLWGSCRNNLASFNQSAVGQRLTGHSKVSTAAAISRPTSQPPGTGVG